MGIELQAAGAGREIQRHELPRRKANLTQCPVKGHVRSGLGAVWGKRKMKGWSNNQLSQWLEIIRRSAYFFSKPS